MSQSDTLHLAQEFLGLMGSGADADSDFGLPFGQDRLVPIFLATLAVRQQNQTIRFQSAAQILDTFGMAKGCKEYRRLVLAFERIFGATIFSAPVQCEGRPARLIVAGSTF